MYRSNSNQMQHVDSHRIKFYMILQDFFFGVGDSSRRREVVV